MGGWVLDFSKLMQTHLPTKVEVEVEDELVKNVGIKHTGFCLIINLRQTYFFQFLGGGDPFQLRSWSKGRLKLKSSLEKPSDKCQKTHIIQNSFHGA